MNIANLAEVIRDVKPDLTSVECNLMAAALLKRMSHILLTRGQLRLRGIGKLVVVLRPSRRGRNPATGQQLLIPERHQVRFVVGVAMQQLLQQHKSDKGRGGSTKARLSRPLPRPRAKPRASSLSANAVAIAG